MRKPLNFESVLIFLSEKLKKYDYVIRGTASLVLQNIEMNVDDIDILCDRENAYAINKALKEYVTDAVDYKESESYKSCFGKFNIKGVLVEVMGDWQIKNSGGVWSRIFDGQEYNEVKVNGNIIKVSTIESEIEMFTNMQRWNALRKIKEQLEDKKSNQPKLL